MGGRAQGSPVGRLGRVRKLLATMTIAAALATVDGTRRLEIYATPLAYNDAAVTALRTLIDKAYCP